MELSVADLHEDINAMATVPPGEAPRVMLTGRRVDIDIICAGKRPLRAEVDAMERICEVVTDARDLFRAAYRQANP